MKRVKITIDEAYKDHFVSALKEAKITDYSTNVSGNNISFMFKVPDLETLFMIGEQFGSNRNRE